MKKIAIGIALLASIWILFGSWFWTCKVQHNCAELYANEIEAPTSEIVKLPQHLYDNGFFVYFDFGKSKITEEGIKTLDNFSNIVKDADKINININGHADIIGNEKFNEALSSKRAEKVKKYLMLKGISKENMNLSYFGADLPKASNKTEDGRKLNRRVQIKLNK